MGFPLTRGPGGLRFDDGIVQCPWHNSRFHVCSGENLDWATGSPARQYPAGHAGWSHSAGSQYH